MVRLLIYLAIALGATGMAWSIWHSYQTGQEAKAARAAMCEAQKAGMQAEGLMKCTNENLAEYVKRKDKRNEELATANAANAEAIQAQAESLEQNRKAVEAQATRQARTEANLRALVGRVQQVKATSEAARRFLATPVPPEVEALLEPEAVR